MFNIYHSLTWNGILTNQVGQQLPIKTGWQDVPVTFSSLAVAFKNNIFRFIIVIVLWPPEREGVIYGKGRETQLLLFFLVKMSKSLEIVFFISFFLLLNNYRVDRLITDSNENKKE